MEDSAVETASAEDVSSYTDEQLGKLITDFETSSEEVKTETESQDNKSGNPSDEKASDNEPEKSQETPEKQAENEQQVNNVAGDSDDKTVKDFQKPEEYTAYLEQKVANLKKAQADQNKFIGHQGNKIGDLVKNNGNLQAQIDEIKKTLPSKEAVNSKYFDDPSAATEALLQRQEGEREIKRLEIQKAINQNRMVIEHVVPNYHELVNEIADLAKADGINPQAVEAYRQNPYAVNPDLAITYARRVKDRQEAKKTEGRIIGLEKRIDELKGNPEKIIHNLNNLGKQKPVTAALGAKSSALDVSDDMDVTALSDEQLEQLLKKQGAA